MTTATDLRVMDGNKAAAMGVLLCRPDLVASSPISPQTPLLEALYRASAEGRLHAETVEVGLAGVVPASAIALEELGRPAANTAMLGAFARLTGWVSRAAVLDVLPDYFDGEALAGNRRAVERGHDEMVPGPAGEVVRAIP